MWGGQTVCPPGAAIPRRSNWLDCRATGSGLGLWVRLPLAKQLAGMSGRDGHAMEVGGWDVQAIWLSGKQSGCLASPRLREHGRGRGKCHLVGAQSNNPVSCRIHGQHAVWATQESPGASPTSNPAVWQAIRLSGEQFSCLASNQAVWQAIWLSGKQSDCLASPRLRHHGPGKGKCCLAGAQSNNPVGCRIHGTRL